MKKKQLLIMMLLIYLVVGCTSNTPILSATPPTTTRMVTESVTNSSPTFTLTPQSTVFPTETASAQDTRTTTPTILPTSTPVRSISPQFMSICPQQKIVPFEDLSIPQDIHLLVLPGELYTPGYVHAPLFFSPGESPPQPVPDLGSASWKYGFSPDHQWIYFYRPGDNENYETVWVSSLDGEEQWPVAQIHENNYAIWVSEQEIFIVGSPDAEAYEELPFWAFMPFLSINPFTLEQKSLTYVAGDQRSGRYYYGYLSSSNQSYTIYYDGKMTGVEFYIYDYIQDKSIPVFQWLKEVDPVELMGLSGVQPIWIYDGNKFAVTVSRPYGIDLALDLDISFVSEDRRYSDVMREILLPEHLLPANVLGILPGGEDVAFKLLDATTDGQAWFYVLDYQRATLIDYCFNLAGSTGQVKFSPDGRFIAVTFDPTGVSFEQDQPYVGILDLEKGFEAYLSGYSVVDWFVVPGSE